MDVRGWMDPRRGAALALAWAIGHPAATEVRLERAVGGWAAAARRARAAKAAAAGMALAADVALSAWARGASPGGGLGMEGTAGAAQPGWGGWFAQRERHEIETGLEPGRGPGGGPKRL